MPPVQSSRADLESLLRARRLDRTLTTALPPLDPHDEYALGPTGITALDAVLGGGFPRGQQSEIVGARSSGRASVLIRAMAAATARGELVGLVDALDMLDVESAAAAGVDFRRLLWIRGHVVSHPGFCRDLNQRAVEQAIRALGLVLSAGNFGLAVFDAGDAPPDALARLPFTTWLRLQRMVEGRQTICLLVGSAPVARSAAGLTVQVRRTEGASGRVEDPAVDTSRRARRAMFSGRLFEGLDIEARVVRARRPVLKTSARDGGSASAIGSGAPRALNRGFTGDASVALTTCTRS